MKKFSTGQMVQVQRLPSASWETAIYVAPEQDWAGFHRVELPIGAERYIDRLQGGDCDPAHPNARKTRLLIIPSRRIKS